MQPRHLVIPLALALAACSDPPLPTGPDTGLNLEIADAASDYKGGFYWLPPMVAQPVVAGTFDADLTPTVEICALAGETCGPVLATFTPTDGPGGEVVRLETDDQQYHVNWHTDEFALSTTSFYRISVRAGVQEVLLGYADVQPVSNGSGLKNVDTDEFLGLVDGRTLPVKFRIETGVVGVLEVQPVEATAEPGATQQFVAVLSDLHGNPITADVAWSSSDEAVATVDQTGLATAIADGVTIITATSERITGSAMLTIEGGLVVAGAGRGHACALATDGRAFCWGRNDQGQLGNGTLFDRSTPGAVSGGLTFTAITTGDFHTCALTPAGQAWCWGAGSTGEIGDGGLVRRLTPVAVSGGLTFTAISAGTRNTCGLTADNQAWCWGEGFFGALGNGSQTRAATPVPVSGGLAFASISAGQQYTCGVTTDGQSYCWGNGNVGVLGNGSNANRLTPVAVAGGLTFASIDAGMAHTCGVTTAGEGYCWGAGLFGRLGNGSTANQSTPFPVSGGLAWATISAGGLHTCGVTTAGTGYCWGGNVDGSIGDGTGFSRSTPTAVAGGLTFASITASGVIGPTFSSSSQFAFSCGVSVEGQTYCWGSGFFGQIGNGSTLARLVPTPVAAFPE